MKYLIAVTLNDHETSIVVNYKAAVARKDGSHTSALYPLKKKARQFSDARWEALLTIATGAASELASLARNQLSEDPSVQEEVIAPLTAFVGSFQAAPDTWLAGTPEGSTVASDVAAGFLKTLALLESNPRLRMRLLGEFNKSVEKAVDSNGVKVVLDSKTSTYTKKPLKPLSKRDLTAQVCFATMFLTDNPDGFTIH